MSCIFGKFTGSSSPFLQYLTFIILYNQEFIAGGEFVINCVLKQKVLGGK
jgi:hypothetical protein